jgi:erythronate-4-phosphate dehydrogenase
VGKKVLQMAEELGIRIVLNDPPRMRSEGLCGFVTLDGLVREADIITFHVPLNMEGEDKTYHLADDTFFEKINPGTIIINSSRGEVVKTGALKNALHSGLLKAAVIDVWENEPNIDPELMKMLDLATPHIAGYSLDGKANGTAMSVNALCNYFNLPYDNWFPQDIPSIEQNKITINCVDKDTGQVLTEAVSHTYNIKSDSDRLKGQMEQFEKFRGEYPLRREYVAYEVDLVNGNDEFKKVLEKFGFIVV